MKLLIILFSLLLSLPLSAQTMFQTYRITFESNWNQRDHISVPRNAHFSPVVAVAHNAGYLPFPIGGIANSNLEQVAELGNHGPLNNEVMQAGRMGLAGDLQNTENLFIRQSPVQTFTITVSPAHPYFSFVTMIAPSPDWIVGVSQLKLYSDETGFVGTPVVRIPLYAYDGGTEQGDVGGNYSINNPETNPKQPITRLMGPGFDQPFAFVTIEPMF